MVITCTSQKRKTFVIQTIVVLKCLLQAWRQVHWFLYLSTLKYTLLSTCTVL